MRSNVAVGTSLASRPSPDFIDHFPILARGHGRMKKPGRGERAKLCASPTCKLNLRGRGEDHDAGRAKNAAEWMRSVSYDGPSPGIPAAKPEKPLKERLIPRILTVKMNCAQKCVRMDIHSVCVPPHPPSPFI